MSELYQRTRLALVRWARDDDLPRQSPHEKRTPTRYRVQSNGGQWRRVWRDRRGFLYIRNYERLSGPIEGQILEDEFRFQYLDEIADHKGEA